MLRDLNQIGLEARARRDQYLNTEIALSDDFKRLYKKRFPATQTEFFDYTSVSYTPKGLSIIIPNQWFIIASFFTEFLESLLAYKRAVDELNLSAEQIAAFRKQKSIDDEAARDKIERRFADESEQALFIKFLTDYEWWFGSKTIDRSDFFVSPILNLASVVHITQGHIASLAHQLQSNYDLVALLQQTVAVETEEAKAENIRVSFAKWLVSNTNNNYFNNDFDRTLAALDTYQKKYEEEFKTPLFDIDFNDLDNTIQTIHSNIWNKDSAFWAYSEKQSTHQPRAILGDENYLRFLKKYSTGSLPVGEVEKGYNRIYFGAPGTGKSYTIAKLLQENQVSEDQIERVTFHPDFDYNAFVGGYKPVTETNGGGEEVIKYKFVPQVFTNIYVKARQDPARNYYLIIEEINRGNCAEIFGDVFQLLDRNPDYKVSPAEDLRKYLEYKGASPSQHTLEDGKMVMPDNLIILATMNTSDQSLYPMDSAFKRRWDWVYVPINYPESGADNSCQSFGYQVRIDDKSYIKWIEFIKSVNGIIVQNPNLGMDKCLGNFFIKPSNGVEIEFRDFVHKVLFYLWSDVFKDEDNDVFQDHTYLSYFPVESAGKERFKELAARIGMTIYNYGEDGYIAQDDNSGDEQAHTSDGE